MTSQLRDPIYLTSGGAKTALLVGLSLSGGDTVASMDDVTITTSSEDLVVTNAAITGGSATINGRTYTSGQVIGYDLAYTGPTLPGGAIAGYVDFTWASVGGNGGTDRVLVEITPFVFGDYSSTPASYYGPSYDTVLGITSGATNLGTFTNRNNSYPTIAANRTVKGALQDLLDAHERDWVWNVLDFANSAAAVRAGTEDASICIQRAIDAAAAQFLLYVAQGSGASINRRFMPTVYLPHGEYTIQNPITLATTSHNINLLANRAVLKKGNSFPARRYAIEIGTADQYQLAPMFMDVTGLVFVGFERDLRVCMAPANINLGEIRIRECQFVGTTTMFGLGVVICNRSCTALVEDCQFDNMGMEVQSCDIVVVRNCRCQILTFPLPAARENPWAPFIVRRGQLKFQNCLLNTPTGMGWNPELETTFAVGDLVRGNSTNDSPDKGVRWYRCKTAHTLVDSTPGPATVFNEAYIAANWDIVETAANPVGWIKAEDFLTYDAAAAYYIGDLRFYDAGSGTKLYVCTAAHQAAGSFVAGNWTDTYNYISQTWDIGNYPLAVWCDVEVDSVLFGGEGGGIVSVIWNIAPDELSNSVQLQRGVRISNCTVGCDLRGYTVSGMAPVVLLMQIPNTLIVENNKYGFTYLVAADYWVTTPPTMWEPPNSQIATKPQETYISGNHGSATRNIATYNTTFEQYGPDYAPVDLAVPTIRINNGAAIIPGCARGRTFKTSATAHTGPATLIDRFIGVSNGDHFRLWITDETFSVQDGNYIKTNGTFNPGVGGGVIELFVANNTDTPAKGIAYEISRTDFQ